jgi:hypothetical protein
MSSTDVDMQEIDVNMSGTNTFGTKTLTRALPQATPPTITHEKTPPYSVVWERVWPTDKTIPQRIAAGMAVMNVGEVFASDALRNGFICWPSCTVRYILAPRTNTKSAHIKAAVRTATLEQLADDDEIWDDVQISFPPYKPSAECPCEIWLAYHEMLALSAFGFLGNFW